jgi:hypothetical protein
MLEEGYGKSEMKKPQIYEWHKKSACTRPNARLCWRFSLMLRDSFSLDLFQRGIP